MAAAAPTAVPEDESTAPFAIGVAPPPPKKMTRRIIKARRPPRREPSQSILNAPPITPAATFSVGFESNDDEIILPTPSTIDNDNENSSIEPYAPNVVTPLSGNRFQSLDDDDESISSMPSLSTIRGAENEPNVVSDRKGERQNEDAKSKKVKKKKKKPSKSSKKKGANSAEQDENGPICSICVEADQPNDKWHRLIILPCCGRSSNDDTPKEYKFSTRFCAGCILKLIQVNVEKDGDEYAPWEDERDEFPVDVFCDPSPMLQGMDSDSEVIECPRCRHLVSVGFTWKRKFDYDEDECDCDDCQIEHRRRRLGNGVKSIDISKPTFLSMVKFAGKKRGMASLLWKMTYLPRNMITVEGLGGKEESSRIQQLVGWGVLKKKDDLFYLEKEEQVLLLKLFDVDAEDDSSDDKRDWKMSATLVPCLMAALWDHTKKFHLFRALKMLNHIGITIHHFGRNLPHLPLSFGQEMAVTGLNVFCAWILLRLSLAVVVNGVLLVGSVFLVCRVLRFSARQTSKTKQDLVLACPFLVAMCYFGYRCNNDVLLCVQSVMNYAWTWLQAAKTANVTCYFSSVLNVLETVSGLLGQ